MNSLKRLTFFVIACSVILTSQQSFAMHEEEEESICARFLNGPVQLTVKDVELFHKSKKGPVLSGGVLPDEKYLKFDSSHDKNKLVNEWHVYFIRNDFEKCYDSPSRAMIGLKERLNAMAARRLAVGDVHHPLRIFFVCGKIHYDNPSPFGKDHDKDQLFNDVHERGSNSFFDITYGLLIKDRHSFVRHSFGKESAVIFLSDGDAYGQSAWSDDFIAGHEVGHAASFNYLGTPKYFNEGQADFKAFLNSGKTTTTHYLGSDRDIADPQYKTIDDFFDNFSRVADNYQIGSMLAHYFYALWQKQKQMGIDIRMNSMFYRVMSLMTEASPLVAHDGAYVTIKTQDKYKKEDAQKALNLMASMTLQWSLEQKLPREVTRWMCYRWTEYVGVKGPFKRYRIYESPQTGRRRLDFSEKQYSRIKIPAEWNSCDHLFEQIDQRR